MRRVLLALVVVAALIATIRARSLFQVNASEAGTAEERPAGVTNPQGVPKAQTINGTALCFIESWAFGHAWNLPENGHATASLEACAEACANNPLCTGADWTSPFDPKLRRDCWLKGWPGAPNSVPTPCMPAAPEPGADPNAPGSKVTAIFKPAGESCEQTLYSNAEPQACNDENQQSAAGAAAALDVPPARAIGTTGMCVIKHMDWADRWDPKNNSRWAETVGDCASQCKAYPHCQGAAYIEYADKYSVTENCWFKNWANPDVKAAAPCFHHELEYYTRYAILTPTANGDCGNIHHLSPVSECGVENEAYDKGEDAPGEDSDDTPWPAVAGGIGGAVVLLILAAVLAVRMGWTKLCFRGKQSQGSFMSQGGPVYVGASNASLLKTGSSMPPGSTARSGGWSGSMPRDPHALNNAQSFGSGTGSGTAAPTQRAMYNGSYKQTPRSMGSNGEPHGHGNAAGSDMSSLGMHAASTLNSPSVANASLGYGRSGISSVGPVSAGMHTSGRAQMYGAGLGATNATRGTWSNTLATTIGGSRARYLAHLSSAQNSTLQDRQEYLQHQLDSLGGQEVLYGLTFNPGINDRLMGGQAVVQFAKDGRSGLEYAVKFFLSPAAFADEARLFTDEDNPLGKFLPEVRNIVDNADSAFVDGYGAPMAPCIVMERGESLDVWSARTADDGLDMITGLQVIHHIAERLEDLHAAGYCHRDLKPANVMWLPRRNRWTLIDFGCAAKIGETAPMGYSLAYAAPEVLKAVKDGKNTIEVSDKIDSWSLGVMAVELLSNQPAFNMLDGKDKVMDQILGVELLPWEDPKQATSLLKHFGYFKNALMSLLERDPTRRPSMEAFRKQCNRVLIQTTQS